MPRPLDSGSTMTTGGFARNLPTVILGAGAFLAPLLTIYAPLGMAPLLAVVAAALVVGWMIDRRPIRLAGPTPWLAVGCLLAWCAASLIWTVNPKGGLVTLGQLSGFFLCALIAFAVATAADSRPIVKALLAGILLALAIYAIERLFGAPIQNLFKDKGTEPEGLYSTFNRGLAVLIVLVPVAIIAFRKSHVWLCLFLAAATTALTVNYYGAAMILAAVVAWTVFAAALAGPWLVRAIGVAAMIGILVAPFVARHVITPDLVESVSRRNETISAQHRLIIWRFASGRILEKPITGWGLDASRAIPGGKDRAVVHSKLCQAPCALSGEQLPLHPHNMALQLWLELGAVGAAIGATIILGLFWMIAAAPVSRIDRALLAAQASAGLVIAGLSYGVWQIWWLSALAFAGVLSLCVIGRPSKRDQETPATSA